MVQWLPDFKSGFKKQTSPHWIQDSPNFEAWRYPDQIKAWLLLMHNSNAFSHPFEWIFVLSWQRDNAVMHSWTTFPKQKANKKKTQGLPLQLTHKHQAQTVTWRFQGGASCLEPYKLCPLLGTFLQRLSLLISLRQKKNYLLNEPQKLFFLRLLSLW